MNRSHDVESVSELERTAELGESGKTPFILIGDVWVVCALAVLAVLGITLVAYFLAT